MTALGWEAGMPVRATTVTFALETPGLRNQENVCEDNLPLARGGDSFYSVQPIVALGNVNKREMARMISLGKM